MNKNLMREVLANLSNWRPNSYSAKRLAMMEQIILRETNIKTGELERAMFSIMADWTGAGSPDVGDFKARVYRTRREGKEETGDPTASDAQLYLGGHDGHEAKFMNRLELTRERARLLNLPASEDPIQIIVDRVCLKAVETGLRRAH